MAIDSEKWVSIDDICSYLSMKRQTVLNCISKKQMPTVIAGNLWRFKISEVDERLRSQNKYIWLPYTIK